MNDHQPNLRVDRWAWRPFMNALFTACLAFTMTGVDLQFASAAQDVSFAGKTIIVDAPTVPGGGYDIYARALAQFLPNHLPGSPHVIVRNRPGAGGVTLANYIYNTAPKDGTEIAGLQSGTVFDSVLTGKPSEFEPAQFGWLGSLDKFVPIVIVWHSKPFYSFDDLKMKPMTVGATGVGSNSVGYPYSLNAFLGTKFKVVNGYPGTPNVTLAIERGELDGYASWCWDCLKQQKPDWYKEKKVRVLLQLSFEGDPELTAMGVPTIADVVKTDEQRKIMSIILAGADFGRPFVAPPGIAPAILKVWQKAFEETAHDPALAAEMNASGGAIRFSPPDTVQKLIALAGSLDSSTLARLRAAYTAGRNP